MPFLIAQVDAEEQAALEAAGYEVLAEGSMAEVRAFFEGRGGGEGLHVVVWLEDGPLETLGIRSRSSRASLIAFSSAQELRYGRN